MKRILLLALPLSLLVVSAACKSSSNADDTNTADAGSGNPTGDNNGGGDGGGGPGDPTINPIEGATTANPFAGKDTAILPSFLDGPVWSIAQNVLLFSAPESPEGFVLRFKVDGSGGVTRQAEAPLRTVGMTIDPTNGDLISVSEKAVHRMPVTGTALADPASVVIISSAYDPATNPPSTDEFDPTKVAPPGTGAFDSLNDVVVSKAGHMYITDPGYGVEPEANRIFWLPAGANTAKIVAAYENLDHPNGIALSPDEKALYVSYTSPHEQPPYVGKFAIADDGSIDNKVAPAKFAVLADGSIPDGLACDTAGNVYVATATGVLVFKVTGEPWGTIAVAAPAGATVTGLTFGGPDLKTLFITTGGPSDVGAIFTVTTKVAGLAQ